MDACAVALECAKWLNDLRSLLFVGFIAAIVLTALLFTEQGPARPPKSSKPRWDPSRYCPIGRTDMGSCPHCRMKP